MQMKRFAHFLRLQAVVASQGLQESLRAVCLKWTLYFMTFPVSATVSVCVCVCVCVCVYVCVGVRAHVCCMIQISVVHI